MQPLQPNFSALDDLGLLEVCLFGETRGEPIEGQIGVANVIRNRVRLDLGGDNKPDWWGEGYKGVISCYAQFSCLWPELGGINYTKVLAYANNYDKLFNAQLRWIATGILDDYLADNTHGATHYHAVSLPAPAWTKGATHTVTLGNHTFFTGVK